MRYSPARDIDRSTVSRLAVAWTFHVRDVSDGSADRKRSGFESTPIVVDGTLYVTTGYNRVIALDPTTGTQRWTFDPLVDDTGDYGDGLVNRGVATWVDAARDPSAPCRRRIFEATLDARLLALDAATGRLCADFGEQGQVSLRNVPRYVQGWYHMTSPPAVIDDLVIVGSAVDDNPRVDMPSGVVRAFDARTGSLQWSWDPIPPNSPATPAWRTGAGNAWAPMAVDAARDLVFVPTGSASPDYYGGLRRGDDKWANSIVALRARSGVVAWGFQLVHHDLWDYDSASPPLLASLRRDGKDVPVVIQGNKTGFLYVFDRDSGEPFFPVQERAVPASDVPGEDASPTQPFPARPPALAPQQLAADDAWGLTSADRDACRLAIQKLRNEGIFTPPSLRGSLHIPGTLGGMNWSGSAFDPERGLLVVNTNNLPLKMRLIARDEFERRDARNEPGDYTAQRGAPYGMYRTLLRAPASSLPCSKPPWGLLTAIEMNEGALRWQVPLGSFAPDLPAVPPGSLSLGGPIVTAGGLVFVAGTWDPYLRAFDIETGKELWKAKLPASGHATPMTYRLANGKQYVVIAAGGHAHLDEEPQGDSLVAFALP
jgi:quinoprotein glucose dehydrogenase